MKNIALIDFSPESIKALKYAIQFVQKIENATLELVNVSSESNVSLVGDMIGESTIVLSDIAGTSDKPSTSSLEKLNELKNQYANSGVTLRTIELEGNLLDVLPDYLNDEKVGFVFGGTHDLTFLESLFSSRTFKLMKGTHVNFVFVPESVDKVKPIEHVLVPVLSDKHSLQNLEPLIFLRHFMKFKITLCSYDQKQDGQSQNLFVAAKILDKAGVPFSTKYIGSSEKELLDRLVDFTYSTDIDTISIVDYTDESIFNFGMRGFIEGLIRNSNGVPIIAIQNEQLVRYSGFHTIGGY